MLNLKCQSALEYLTILIFIYVLHKKKRYFKQFYNNCNAELKDPKRLVMP